MPSVPTNNIGIQPMFITKNRTYTNPSFKTKKKLMLHSTATPGAPAQNFFNSWNSASASTSVEFFLDNEKILQYMPIGANGVNCYKTWHCGASGNNTHIATEVCEPIQAQLIPVNFLSQSLGGSNNRSYSIQRIQMELQYRGFYKGAINGVFNSELDAAVKSFRRNVGLSVSGVVDRNTLAKLASRAGSYCAYDVEGATPFFNAAYNNAVALFGFLCKYVGAKASEIVCHSEGYRKGIASNHGDVEHWFPYHGKSMNDFRADVQKYLDGTWVPLGTPANPVATYLQCVEKIHDAGIVGTPGYWENLDSGNVTVNMDYAHSLIQNAGVYFCNKNHTCAVDAITEPLKLNSPLYWKGATFSASNVQFLLKAIATDGDHDADLTYEEAVNRCAELGYLSDTEYWMSVTDMKGNAGSNNTQWLLKKVGSTYCEKDWKYAVRAIENIIGMNSPDYWLNTEQYSVLNIKYLVIAIAEAL